MTPGETITLWDGRRGYFYRSRMAGTILFQPIDAAGRYTGQPELADGEDHELADQETT